MKAHKFVSNRTDHTYAVTIFCEYCGVIAFQGNTIPEKLQQEYAKNVGTECPNGIDLQLSTDMAFLKGNNQKTD